MEMQRRIFSYFTESYMNKGFSTHKWLKANRQNKNRKATYLDIEH